MWNVVFDSEGGRKIMPNRSYTSGNLYDDYKFTGHERDDEFDLTLDYMQARMYDPVIGRFLSVDPILSEQNPIDLIEMESRLLTTTPYGYVFGNPVMLTDPDGRCPTCIAVLGVTLETFWEHGQIEFEAEAAFSVGAQISGNLSPIGGFEANLFSLDLVGFELNDREFTATSPLSDEKQQRQALSGSVLLGGGVDRQARVKNADGGFDKFQEGREIRFGNIGPLQAGSITEPDAKRTFIGFGGQFNAAAGIGFRGGFNFRLTLENDQ